MLWPRVATEAEDIFGSIFILAVGVVMIGAILGWNVSGLIDALPGIIVFALVIALTVGIARTILS